MFETVLYGLVFFLITLLIQYILSNIRKKKEFKMRGNGGGGTGWGTKEGNPESSETWRDNTA